MLQHLRMEKHQRLPVRWGRHLARRGEPAEKGFHLGAVHFRRVPDAVKADEGTDPVNVGLLGTTAVMQAGCVRTPDRAAGAIAAVAAFALKAPAATLHGLGNPSRFSHALPATPSFPACHAAFRKANWSQQETPLWSADWCCMNEQSRRCNARFHAGSAWSTGSVLWRHPAGLCSNPAPITKLGRTKHNSQHR